MANKYVALKVDGKRVDEHRYIMEKHLGRKLTRKEVVHHIDENKANNDLSNLQVMSYKEHNALHGHTSRITNSTNRTKPPTKHGSTNSAAKLNEELVLLLREEFKDSRKGLRKRARELGISHKTLGQLLDRKSWKHI